MNQTVGGYDQENFWNHRRRDRDTGNRIHLRQSIQIHRMVLPVDLVGYQRFSHVDDEKP